MALPKPLLEWGFEEPGQTVTDYSGNGYDFSIMSELLKVDGHTGKGLQARPSAGSPNYTIPSVGLETTSRTMMVWVKRGNEASGYQHAIWFENGGSSVWAIAAEDDADRVWFRAKNQNGSSFDSTSTPSPPTGEWHHYAMTFSPSNGVKTYIDGVLKDVSGAGFATNILHSGGPQQDVLRVIYVGGNTQVLDDVRLYDVALTDAQIVEAMNTPAAPFVPPSISTTLWNGSQEVPVSLTVWDGSQELPASVEIA